MLGNPGDYMSENKWDDQTIDKKASNQLEKNIHFF